MSTPTPRPALKATGMRRRHARCLETELAALTAERDQLRAEVKSCGELSCDECNARTAALTAERDQLRAEAERLRSDRDCEKRLRKDADELREDALERAMKATKSGIGAVLALTISPEAIAPRQRISALRQAGLAAKP